MLENRPSQVRISKPEEASSPDLEKSSFPKGLRAELTQDTQLSPAAPAEGLPCPPRNREIGSTGFREAAQESIFPGRSDQPVLLFYGGLGGTSWPWREFAKKLNADLGNRAELHSLKGHDGYWDSLLATNHESWVQDLLEKGRRSAALTGMKPILFGYSTSAAAAIDAAAREPELFGGLVLVGVPIQLKSRTKRAALIASEWCDRFVPPLRPLFRRIPISLPADPPNSDPEKLLAQQPKLHKLPLASLLALIRLQRSAREALDGVTCPVLLIHGGQDKYTKPDVIAKMFAMFASEAKEFVTYPSSPHPVMLGVERQSMFQTVQKWLTKRQQPPTPPTQAEQKPS